MSDQEKHLPAEEKEHSSSESSALPQDQQATETSGTEASKTEDIAEQSKEKDSKNQVEQKDAVKLSAEEMTTPQKGADQPEKDSAQAPEKIESPAMDDRATSVIPRPAAAGKARPTPAARPRAKAKEEEKPLEPSHRQPLLDQFVATIQEKVAKEAIVESYINRPNDHLPTLVISKEHWLEVARCLKEEESLAFDYVRNYSGVDYETHLEAVVHLTSFTHSHHIGVRVKTDREEATLPSISSIWSTADWNEREIYDLLGIRFEGHPNLKRILMPDDWVGHPLRKDYEPLDKEV